MNDSILPLWAKAKLKGSIISEIVEDQTYAISIVMTNGDVLSITAMPFSEPELDAQFIEDAR